MIIIYLILLKTIFWLPQFVRSVGPGRTGVAIGDVWHTFVSSGALHSANAFKGRQFLTNVFLHVGNDRKFTHRTLTRLCHSRAHGCRRSCRFHRDRFGQDGFLELNVFVPFASLHLARPFCDALFRPFALFPILQ